MTCQECEACQWSARRAYEVYKKGADVTTDMEMSEWVNVLRKGCQGEQACDQLMRRAGKAMAGALLDFVEEGDEANEATMDMFDFQGALCSTYGDICKVPL